MTLYTKPLITDLSSGVETQGEFQTNATNLIGYMNSALQLWEASLAYGLGNVVLSSALPNLVYECTVAGTSSSTEPAWPTLEGQTITDGGVTWTARRQGSGGPVLQAQYLPDWVSLTSAIGVLTLTGASNSFIANGSEAITSIVAASGAWPNKGQVQIRWNTSRTLTNSASLILQSGVNRAVQVGDIGDYQFEAGGIIREVGYFYAAPVSASAFPLGLGNYIASGMGVSSISGLVATMASGTAVINNTPTAIGVTPITLPVRKACLLYANSSGAEGYVPAVAPTAYIDNYTVGMWIFNQTLAGAVIPNSAVGLSSLAVPNNLTPTGGISVVDGQFDYALQLDGTTGYFIGSNTTNFPSGASVREVVHEFTINKLPSSQMIINFYGAMSTGNSFDLYINPSGYFVVSSYTTDVLTTMLAEVGKTYKAVTQYDGTNAYLYINGTLAYKGAISLSTTLTYSLTVGAYPTGVYPSYITNHFIELRTKLRSQSTLGAMANSLMLPCFYTKAGAVAPTVPSAYSSTYHEYLFNEASGTSVADSNTTSALTGTAANTTVGASDIGLTNARVFASASSYVNLGSFAMANTFTYIGVVYLTSYANSPVLWSNLISGNTAGNFIFISSTGLITFESLTSSSTLGTNPIPLNTPVFIAITINGTTATLYQQTPYKSLQTIVPAPNTTAGVTYFGYCASNTALYIQGKLLYTFFVNAELSQAEIDYYYTQLMATGRRSIIDDVSPANSIVLAYARTSSSKIIEYNDTDYGYGRREKAVGGNRWVFLGWQYYTAGLTRYWQNPFKSTEIDFKVVYSATADHTKEVPVYCYYANAWYGISIDYVLPFYISVSSWGTTNIVYSPVATGISLPSGYVGIYARVMEDYKQ